MASVLPIFLESFSEVIPVTIVHGDEDEVVPVTVSESYVAAHPRTCLVKLRGVAHFALIDPETNAWPAVVRALDRLAGIR